MSDKMQELKENIKNHLITLSKDDLVVVEVDFSDPPVATTKQVVNYCDQINNVLKEFKDKGFNFLVVPKAKQFPTINFLPLDTWLEENK